MCDACYCNSSRVRTADHSSCSPPHHIHLNSQFLAKANHQRARGFTRLAFQHKYFKPFIIDEWPVDRSRGGHSHRPYSHSCDCSRSMVNGQSRRNGCGQRSKPPKRVRSTVKAAQKYSQQRSPPYSKCMACQYTGITISGIRWTAQECFYLRRLGAKSSYCFGHTPVKADPTVQEVSPRTLTVTRHKNQRNRLLHLCCHTETVLRITFRTVQSVFNWCIAKAHQRRRAGKYVLKSKAMGQRSTDEIGVVNGQNPENSSQSFDPRLQL